MQLTVCINKKGIKWLKLILLPIDQRYDIKEMKLILKITNNNN